jgi:xanthine dehydrogenase accessory factor
MAESNEIWSEAVRTLESDRPFALATVVNVRGSTPREIGAKMLVRKDGQAGTIGGGCGEAEVFRKARLLLNEGGGTRLVEVDLTGDFEQEQIGTCGGVMDVLISLWSPTDDLAVARRLADYAAQSRPGALLTQVDGAEHGHPAGAKSFIDGAERPVSDAIPGLNAAAVETVRKLALDAKPELLEVDADGSVKPAKRTDPSNANQIFVDPVSGAQRLIIAGAGHIAQPLAALGSMLGFHVTVIDDRAAFANRERFPNADEIVVKPFAAAIDSLRLDRHSYLIAVTRGHAFDEATLRAALRKPDGFIGMIGSRRRVKATLARLAADGFDPKALEQVHAPIGLDIGADTPEEIAIAIMAEIIRERRTGRRDELNLGVKSGRLRSSSNT